MSLTIAMSFCVCVCVCPWALFVIHFKMFLNATHPLCEQTFWFHSIEVCHDMKVCFHIRIKNKTGNYEVKLKIRNKVYIVRCVVTIMRNRVRITRYEVAIMRQFYVDFIYFNCVFLQLRLRTYNCYMQSQ